MPIVGSLYAFEFLAPVAIAAAFLVAVALPRSAAKAAVIFFVVVQLFALAARPSDYNSDTSNYFGYLDLIANTEGLELLLLTKFEPLHLLMAVGTGDFRDWLRVEGLACAALALGLVVKSRRLETIAVVLGSALPLYSSSLRFCLGVLLVALLALHLREGRARLIGLSLAGAGSHVSLAVAGIFSRSRIWVVLLVLVAFGVFAAFDPALLERAGASEDNEVRATGVRALIPFIILLLLCWRRHIGGEIPLAAYAGSALLVLLATITFFPLLNRWLTVLLILFATDLDRLWPRTRRHYARSGEIASALLLYACLVIPLLLPLTSRILEGDW
jgi:hypothetical protein